LKKVWGSDEKKKGTFGNRILGRDPDQRRREGGVEIKKKKRRVRSLTLHEMGGRGRKANVHENE